MEAAPGWPQGQGRGLQPIQPHRQLGRQSAGWGWICSWSQQVGPGRQLGPSRAEERGADVLPGSLGGCRSPAPGPGPAGELDDCVTG